MTARPGLVAIDRADLRVGDRLWGEPHLLAWQALIVEKITKASAAWLVDGRDDEGGPSLMLIADPQVLIEPRD